LDIWDKNHQKSPKNFELCGSFYEKLAEKVQNGRNLPDPILNFGLFEAN